MTDLTEWQRKALSIYEETKLLNDFLLGKDIPMAEAGCEAVMMAIKEILAVVDIDPEAVLAERAEK